MNKVYPDARSAIADVIVLGLPMYNFGVPVQLKSWIDAVARAGVTFRYTASGPEGLLKGKTVYVALARGGLMLAPKMGAMAAGAIGEGLMGAGAAASEIRSLQNGQTLTLASRGGVTGTEESDSRIGMPTVNQGPRTGSSRSTTSRCASAA